MSDLAWHFVVRDVERASTWYGDVFGATETSRVTLPDATVMTADLRIGDAVIAIGRELPQWGVLSPESLGGTYGALHVRVDDVDAVWDSAMTGGATPFEPVHDAFWGVRTGQLIDPFGHRWALDQPLRDVPPEEVQRLAAEAFADALAAPAAAPAETPAPEPGVRELRLVVTTEDYDAALAFYRDTLGMTVSAEYLSDDQGRVSILQGGVATLELGDPAHGEYVDAVEVGRARRRTRPAGAPGRRRSRRHPCRRGGRGRRDRPADADAVGLAQRAPRGPGRCADHALPGGRVLRHAVPSVRRSDHRHGADVALGHREVREPAALGRR